MGIITRPILRFAQSRMAEDDLELPLLIFLLLLPGLQSGGRHHTQFMGFWGLNSRSLATVVKALPPKLLQWVLGLHKEITRGSD